MVCTLALLAVVASLADAQQLDLSTAYRERRALVIGIADYGRWSPLNYARRDAEAVGQKLASLGFTVEYLLDRQATKEQIVARLGALQELAEDAQLLVYFAGHGDTLEAGVGPRKRSLGYLVPADAIPGRSFATAISMETLRELSGLLRARHVMFALDACFSGTLLSERAPGVRTKTPQFYRDVLAKPVRYVLTAGTAGQKAVEVGGHGLFTQHFLAALDGAAATSADGIMTGEDIALYVRRTVARVARERYGREQTPVYGHLEGQGDGEFLLATRKLAKLPPPPPPPPPPPEVKRVPEVGTLVIRSPKEPVDVFLGDRSLGEAGPTGGLEIGRLEVGSYHVRARARRDGFKPWQREIRVAATQTTEVVIDIEALGPANVIKTEDGAEMVLVPAGEFWMGSDDGADDERPRHRIHLDTFYIDRFEVTNAQYGRFVQARGRSAPTYAGDARFNGPQQPVVGVSWHDAEAYCAWAGKRLPTEAEWEKAARGTDGRKYPWGDGWDASRANSRESELGKTAPVGSYSGGVSPYGAHDLAGNVWEWVADWYGRDYYQRSSQRNPRGPDSGSSRVLRGGSWFNNPILLRAANRNDNSPGYRIINLGFRCARGLP